MRHGVSGPHGGGTRRGCLAAGALYETHPAAPSPPAARTMLPSTWTDSNNADDAAACCRAVPAMCYHDAQQAPLSPEDIQTVCPRAQGTGAVTDTLGHNPACARQGNLCWCCRSLNAQQLQHASCTRRVARPAPHLAAVQRRQQVGIHHMRPTPTVDEGRAPWQPAQQLGVHNAWCRQAGRSRTYRAVRTRPGNRPNSNPSLTLNS
jgi:hypothetical protein